MASETTLVESLDSPQTTRPTCERGTTSRLELERCKRAGSGPLGAGLAPRRSLGSWPRPARPYGHPARNRTHTQIQAPQDLGCSVCQANLPDHWLDSAPTSAERARRMAALDRLAVVRDGYKVYDGPAVL